MACRIVGRFPCSDKMDSQSRERIGMLGSHQRQCGKKALEDPIRPW